MSKLTKTYILLFAIAVGWWGGQLIGFLVSMNKMPEASPKEVIQEPKIDIIKKIDHARELMDKLFEDLRENPIEYTFKPMWSYYFPNYVTGMPVKINAIDLEAAEWIAEIRGLGTEEVLSTWRQ